MRLPRHAGAVGQAEKEAEWLPRLADVGREPGRLPGRARRGRRDLDPGAGWALATGLNAYSAYAATSPRVAARTTRQIIEALTG